MRASKTGEPLQCACAGVCAVHDNAAMLILRPDSLSGLGCCQHSEVCGQTRSFHTALIANCAAEQALQAARGLPCILRRWLAVRVGLHPSRLCCTYTGSTAAPAHNFYPKPDLPFTAASTLGPAYSTLAFSHTAFVYRRLQGASATQSSPQGPSLS